jgi:hypothetical protein
LRLERTLLLCLLPQLNGAVTVRANTELDIAVCLRLSADVPLMLLVQGENTASELFEDIGIRVHWTCNNEASSIGVRVREYAPRDFHKGAFAYALPYAHEGDRVIVFYDRFAPMAVSTPMVAAIVFGHILAHEIGHVLAGVDSHSESGLMRARWTDEDYMDMRVHKLRFSPEIERYIYQNLSLQEEAKPHPKPELGRQKAGVKNSASMAASPDSP